MKKEEKEKNIKTIIKDLRDLLSSTNKRKGKKEKVIAKYIEVYLQQIDSNPS